MAEAIIRNEFKEQSDQRKQQGQQRRQQQHQQQQHHQPPPNAPKGPAAASVPTGPSSKGFTIRGLAGPFAVMAQNFAPGTTAADIENAMTPIGGLILSCRIMKHNPIVIAEIVFESKEGADNVIATFDKQTVSLTPIPLDQAPEKLTWLPRPTVVFLVCITNQAVLLIPLPPSYLRLALPPVPALSARTTTIPRTI